LLFGLVREDLSLVEVLIALFT